MRNKREIYISDLPSRARQLYLYLYDRADKNGESFPSLKTISKDLKISVRTIQRALKDLEKSGYLSIEKRVRNNGGRSSNLYRIL